MSPTLLELIVAVLLLWVAWQVGVLIAPRVLAAFISFWRNSKRSHNSDKWGAEKNITPPAENPPHPHGRPH